MHYFGLQTRGSNGKKRKRREKKRRKEKPSQGMEFLYGFSDFCMEIMDSCIHDLV